MADVTISPNMGLPIPTVSVAPGPAWASNINSSLNILDGHNHTTGQGNPITPGGMLINTDLPFSINSLTGVKSVRFSPLVSPLASGADVGCLYESGVDLYYNDGAGNQIRITQSGSVTGAAGTITGLPSGTASASYSGGTFTFESATLTPATMNVGPLVIGQSVVSSPTVTLTPNGAQASNYSLTLPVALPVANESLLVVNTDGTTQAVTTVTSNLTFSGTTTFSGPTTGLGIVPIGTLLPGFFGAAGAYTPAGTTVADANGYVLCQGQTIADATSPMNGVTIPDLRNEIFLMGSSAAIGTTGGSNAALVNHQHGPGTYYTIGGLAISDGLSIGGGTASLTGTTTFSVVAHSHLMSHVHQWGYMHNDAGTGTTGTNWYAAPSQDPSITTFDQNTVGSGGLILAPEQASLTGSSFYYGQTANGLRSNFTAYTGGVLDPQTGSAGSTAATSDNAAGASVGISSTGAYRSGSIEITGDGTLTGSSAVQGTGTDSRPYYITVIYIIRIK